MPGQIGTQAFPNWKEERIKHLETEKEKIEDQIYILRCELKEE
jgi:hypothetical protein